MKCPKCQFENEESARFCSSCGQRLELLCPECGKSSKHGSRFCSACGHRLEDVPAREKPIPPTDSERKHVTVLFSDISGYTAMTEKLDPEEVKEIMGRVFGEISQVVARYEGFIEKFIGDAVMALFGAPKTHEDDPVRAIKAAREIHDIVSAISPKYEKRIGKPLSMHTGICTGLVVTGDVNLEKGTHGVLGDTINTASRLSGLAKPGEIVVGTDTYHQAEGYFFFEPLEATAVKGKTELVKPYKVSSPREDPTTTHRISGLRAELIGRKVEMAQLQEALQNLRQGKGSIFSIVGDAGTGKSRLIEDFKSNLDLTSIQWREGHAYAYAQNIPYFPLIDLLSRVYQVQEGDSPEQVRQKVEKRTKYLLGEREDLVPYIGSLYSLRYPEIEGVSPEFWKARLHESVQKILSALTQIGPTVVCLEDLHWADLSSIELLRNILSEFRHPTLFLCMYRPPFSLFTSHQASSMAKVYKEIRLHDLSTSESQDMVESLLKAKDIPPELRRFIEERVEGNPFYLEEAINDLIESTILIRDNGSWKLTKNLLEANIPSTVQGIISARLDRLERETKRILQEASVIGRSFLYEILNRITELKGHIDRSLTGLERLDLIRVRSLQPEMEYIFKHALAQEVVYNGLLKKERQVIHEKIGTVMELLFRDRLPEFYETLSFHFKQGHSTGKAVDYLIKAGEKSLNRYALDESDQYFKEAHSILINKPDRSKEDDKILIDLLCSWLLVYYYRGDFRELTDLLITHKDIAETLDDKTRLGMFYACLGFALLFRAKNKDSYEYLRRAYTLGEEANDWQTVAYAATWLTFTCADLNYFDEGIRFGEKAQEACKYLTLDSYPYFKSLVGMGQIYWFKGDCKKIAKIGNTLLDFGRKHSHVRCTAAGHIMSSYSHFTSGDFESAINSAKNATQVSVDRFYTQWSKMMLGAFYVSNDQLTEAEGLLNELFDYFENSGYESAINFIQILLGAVLIAKGEMNRGFNMLQDAIKSCNGRKFWFGVAIGEYILAKVYLQIVEKKKPVNFSTVVKNFGFVIKNVPSAYMKAKDHLNIAIGLSKEFGLKGILAQSYFNLGLLYKIKGKTDDARRYITDAIPLFEECEADVFLKQAQEALAKLG